MGTKILAKKNVSIKIVSQKVTTLSPEFLCQTCGQPAMTNEAGRLRCPPCWLREKGSKISPLDRGGYYPLS